MYKKLVEKFFADEFGGRDWLESQRWRITVFAEWLENNFSPTKRALDAGCGHAYTHDSQPADYHFCPWCGGEHRQRQ